MALMVALLNRDDYMNMFDCMYIVYYNVILNRGDYMHMFHCMYIVYYNVILNRGDYIKNNIIVYEKSNILAEHLLRCHLS
jgi:hypothetical protein